MDFGQLGVIALCTLACFFVCGIPFGLIITNRMAGIDVRKTGSGNIGMTNVARSAGAKAAALTFLCDVGKGTVMMLVCRSLLANFFGIDWSLQAFGAPSDWVPATLYAACVLGHVFSPYLGFHGGKGISVGLGAALGLHWPFALAMLAVFLVLTVPTRYVSLGSIAAAASLPVFAALMGASLRAMVPLIAVSAVVIWSHRANIGRLVRGEEKRFTVKRGGK